MPASIASGERHFRGLGGNAQMGEQRRQVRIGRPVEDDEAGIDRNGARANLRIDRVGMAADSIRLLV
jgi:hypothetical protein